VQWKGGYGPRFLGMVLALNFFRLDGDFQPTHLPLTLTVGLPRPFYITFPQQGQTMANKKNERPNSSTVNPEFITSQIEQALEMYRAQLGMLLQSLTAFILGDVTLVGFAINQQSSSILFLGVAFPIVALYLIIKTNGMLAAMLFTAINLEQQLGGDNEDWLASTLFATANSPDALADLRSIAMESVYDEKIRRLRKVIVPPFRKGFGLIRFLIMLAIIGQIVAPIVLAVFFQWKLF